MVSQAAPMMATQENFYQSLETRRLLLLGSTHLLEKNGLYEMDHGRHTKEHTKGKIGSKAGIEEIVGVARIYRNTTIFPRYSSCASCRCGRSRCGC